MFKFKDLYVALTSETFGAGQQDNLLYFNANQVAPSVETKQCNPVPNGPGGTTACCEGGGYSMVALFLSPDAVELKQYLAGQLAAVEMKKSPIQESNDLGTVAEIEALEQKLNGALGELKDRKALLKKAAVAG